MTGTRKRDRRGLQATLVRPLSLGVALAAILGTAPAETAAQEAVHVAGTIVDDATGEPIGGATVRLADASGSARETITGPDGTFAFAEVLPGEYTLAVPSGLPARFACTSVSPCPRRQGFRILTTSIRGTSSASFPASSTRSPRTPESSARFSAGIRSRATGSPSGSST